MTTPIDELAGRLEAIRAAIHRVVCDQRASHDETLGRCAVAADAVAMDLAARSTPVPASNAAKGLDLPRCVVDHDHEADEGPCAYSVPASNVSEGLREARHESGVTIDIEAMLRQSFEDGRRKGERAALAHVAPEGLNRDVLAGVLFALGYAEPGRSANQISQSYRRALSRPDATEEAER